MAWFTLIPIVFISLFLLFMLVCFTWYARHPEERQLIYVTNSRLVFFFGLALTALLGIAFFYQGAAGVLAQIDFNRQTVARAEGVIVGFESHHAVVRFQPLNGVNRRIEASFADARQFYDKDMRVKVRYCPADPSLADIDDFNHGFGPEIGHMMAGAFFCCLSALLVVFWSWKRKRKPSRKKNGSRPRR